MKKTLTALLSALLVLVFLFSFSSAAFAEGPGVTLSSISNTIKGSGSEDNSSDNGGKPSAADILAASNGRKVVLPGANSYYPNYEYLYVDAPKKNSVYVYPQPDAGKKSSHFAYHGSRVTVLAEENGFGCILYYTSDNVLRAGWINMERLSWTYPGNEITIGAERRDQNVIRFREIPVTWSKENFVGTKQKFSLLNEAAENCVEFTLDYNIISRGDARTNECVGPRTIYVNDGSGWVSVGTFEYKEITPCHVVVRLSQPMKILAVATKADCAKPDVFTFRQSVLDLVCLKNR